MGSSWKAGEFGLLGVSVVDSRLLLIYDCRININTRYHTTLGVFADEINRSI